MGGFLGLCVWMRYEYIWDAIRDSMCWDEVGI